MATLEEKLLDILPSVLPTDPDEAVNGTDLIQRIESQALLEGGYASDTLRNFFTKLSLNPSTNIAKRDQGHGYYLREESSVKEEEKYITPQATHEERKAREHQPEEKFRSIYMRYEEIEEANFPVHIDHTRANRSKAGVNKWKFPGVMVPQWEVDQIESKIDEHILEVKKSIGDPPFIIESTELKVSLSLGSFREYFFQCVSNSKWSNTTSLVIASSVNDELIAEELRRLGASYNVSITSYGMSESCIEDLPPASQISKMSESEFQNIVGEININRISPSTKRESIDWNHVSDMRQQSNEFEDIFKWIAKCLLDKKPFNYSDFKKMSEIEGKY